MSEPKVTLSSDEDFNLYELNRLMDITKSHTFKSKGAAFYGPIMSYLHFLWTEDRKTAATDGVYLMWNPRWFLKIPPETRITVLRHELEHVARLHMVRRGTRHPLIWNYACDIRINNDLDNLGYSFKGTKPWLDHSFDKGGRKAEEEIYDILMAQQQDEIDALVKFLKDNFSGEETDEDEDPGDLEGDEDPTADEIAGIVNTVITATHQARASGCGGDIPTEIEQIIKQFMAASVPWEQEFQKFFTDLLEEDYRWTRPNRRMLDIMYLPSRFEDEGKLDHLVYFEDVSGSISDTDIVRFNSELKYVWDVLQPKKMTIIQFDTRIRNQIELNEGDSFDEVKVVGRGGTCLICVREKIIELKPTAVVIFSDLECSPMQPLPVDIPTVWVAIRNTETPIPFGYRINIR